MPRQVLTRQLGIWEEFLRMAAWKEFDAELTARYELIVSKLIQGSDTLWTDDNMRGRLSEIEFLKTFPEAIIADIKLQLQNHKEIEDERSGTDAD